MRNELLLLRSGALELELSPSIGGAISRFEYMAADRPAAILRKCHSPLGKVLDAASFPLVPFVNRVRGGAFEFRGQTVRLAPNMAGDPSPLHGQGWLAEWTVEHAEVENAELLYRHSAGEWPWEYEARQHFVLTDGALDLRLTCRNLSADTMPCGLGQHPYFNCAPGTRLQTQVGHAWTVDQHVLPVAKVPATGRHDLADRLICGQDLDNGFDGWSGEAMICDPDWPFDLVMSSPQARFFQIYSPAGGGIFVAEPVTHANAAMNAPPTDWPALGLRLLEPGETMTLDMRIEVRTKG